MNQDQVEKVDTRLIALFSRKDLYHLSIKVCLKPPTNQPLSLPSVPPKSTTAKKLRKKAFCKNTLGFGQDKDRMFFRMMFMTC